MVRPAASSPTTVPTVTRRPRMHAFAPMTAGSMAILSNDFMTSLFAFSMASARKLAAHGVR